MFIVGLSGGIGSGKTVASDHFKSLGVSIIDTDVIARKVVEPKTQTLAKLVAHFSSDIVSDDGSLNRAVLRNIAFSSAEHKQALDSITHPAIRQETLRQIDLSKGPFCIVVVPLLSATSPFKEVMDRVLIVTADLELKISRVKKRSGLSRDQILSIMTTQLSDQEREAFADDVIVNDSTLEHVYNEVNLLYKKYTKLALSLSKS